MLSREAKAHLQEIRISLKCLSKPPDRVYSAEQRGRRVTVRVPFGYITIQWAYGERNAAFLCAANVFM